MGNKFTSPIENLIQYTDSRGINYVACYPKDMDLEPWFENMIENYGLFQLTQMFPYVTLVLNPDTGLLEPYKPIRYNAKVTNGFHLLLAKQRELNPEEYALEYKLRLEDAFPDHDEPEVRDIGMPDKDKIILNEQEGFKIDNSTLPEAISINPVKNWHPNRDANGNYMTGYYNPIQYQYPGGYPYRSVPSYLPSYIPSYQGHYPF